MFLHFCFLSVDSSIWIFHVLNWLIWVYPMRSGMNCSDLGIYIMEKKKINHYVNQTLIYRNSICYRFLVLLLNELVLPKSYKSLMFRFHFILLELAFSFYNRCSPRNSIPNLSTSSSFVFQLKFFRKHLRHTATADTQEMIVISSQEKPSHRLLLVSCKLFYARVCT